VGELKGKKIVVGITGGIAAYKAAGVVSKLVQGGAEVQVIMTEAAQRFIAPLTLQTLSGRSVLTASGVSRWPMWSSPTVLIYL